MTINPSFFVELLNCMMGDALRFTSLQLLFKGISVLVAMDNFPSSNPWPSNNGVKFICLVDLRGKARPSQCQYGISLLCYGWNNCHKWHEHLSDYPDHPEILWYPGILSTLKIHAASNWINDATPTSLKYFFCQTSFLLTLRNDSQSGVMSPSLALRIRTPSVMS